MFVITQKLKKRRTFRIILNKIILILFALLGALIIAIFALHLATQRNYALYEELKQAANDESLLEALEIANKARQVSEAIRNENYALTQLEAKDLDYKIFELLILTLPEESRLIRASANLTSAEITVRTNGFEAADVHRELLERELEEKYGTEKSKNLIFSAASYINSEYEYVLRITFD